MRVALSLLIVTLSGAATHQLVIAPYLANIRLNALEGATDKASASTDPYVASPMARENIQEARDLLRIERFNPNLYMLLADNERLIGRRASAAATYEEGLRCCPRPEIYLELGRMQYELGQHREGTANIARAVRFQEDLVEDIIDPVMRQAVEERVKTLQ